MSGGNQNFPRKTKIVCTIGPATSAENRLRQLLLAGMNVARLNFSHGDHESHAEVIRRIRKISSETGRPIAILQDLAGPKVRVGTFSEGSVNLKPGETFTLTARPVEGDQTRVSVSYTQLPMEVQPGAKLMLADGAIELEVEQVSATDIQCRVIRGGQLSSRKGVNCPSGLFHLPILSEKDLEDLRFGMAQDVDYVGLSFVRTAEDVKTAREHLREAGSSIPLIAKIETQAALQNFDEILSLADGIMIARGDLSIETPFTRVPVLQKTLIRRAIQRARPVITATQMLYSMVKLPHPTRAEIADVANAVLDGSDAVMLSEETTVGRYPVRAVEVMDAIARDTEMMQLELPEALPSATLGEEASAEEAVAEAACRLAAQLKVDVIGTLTRSGRTARLAAKYRPPQPILAVTPNARTQQQLCLVRGVLPIRMNAATTSPEGMVSAAFEAAHEHGWRGRKAVFVSESLIRRGVL